MSNIAAIILSFVILVGTASHYGPGGVMERTIEARQRMGHLPQMLPDVDGYVARPYPDDIGKVIWLKPLDYHSWESFLVVDCGGVADGGRAWMLNNNILVEVDYQTATRWGSVGRGIKVEMRFSRPLSECTRCGASLE